MTRMLMLHVRFSEVKVNHFSILHVTIFFCSSSSEHEVKAKLIQQTSDSLVVDLDANEPHAEDQPHGIDVDEEPHGVDDPYAEEEPYDVDEPHDVNEPHGIYEPLAEDT